MIPVDTGTNNIKKLNNAIKEIKEKGINIVIGPLNNEDFDEVKKYSDITFISPSNINPEFKNNIISIGISFESQMEAIIKFLKKKRKEKQLF